MGRGLILSSCNVVLSFWISLHKVCINL